MRESQIPSGQSPESADSADEAYLGVEDEELSEDLRALLSSPLFVGPDPSILDELQVEDEAESAADQIAEQERLDRQAFADNAALEARVAEIYQSIIEQIGRAHV